MSWVVEVSPSMFALSFLRCVNIYVKRSVGDLSPRCTALSGRTHRVEVGPLQTTERRAQTGGRRRRVYSWWALVASWGLPLPLFTVPLFRRHPSSWRHMRQCVRSVMASLLPDVTWLAADSRLVMLSSKCVQWEAWFMPVADWADSNTSTYLDWLLQNCNRFRAILTIFDQIPQISTDFLTDYKWKSKWIKIKSIGWSLLTDFNRIQPNSTDFDKIQMILTKLISYENPNELRSNLSIEVCQPVSTMKILQPPNVYLGDKRRLRTRNS